MERQRVTYEEAVADPALRQAYLDGVDLGDMAPYIRAVRYVEKNEEYNENNVQKTMMMIRWSLFHELGIPARSTIDVYPWTFESGHPECDVLSMLVAHEGKHAKDLKEHINFYGLAFCKILHGILRQSEEVKGDRLHALAERRANHAQHMAHKRGHLPLSDVTHERQREDTKELRRMTRKAQRGYRAFKRRDS